MIFYLQGSVLVMPFWLGMSKSAMYGWRQVGGLVRCPIPGAPTGMGEEEHE